MEKVHGIVPALITAFDQNNNIDEPMGRRLVRFMLDKGCAGFFVCGSTGEGFLMSLDERKQYLELILSEVAGQVPVIAHVGALATDDAIELARHARTSGADCVSSVAPFYYPCTVPAILDHYRLIARAAELPIYVYYIPHTTGVTLTAQEFIDDINNVPGIAGIKFTDYNLFLFNSIVQASGGKLNILSGADELCLPALTMGSDGAIGTFYNLFPDLFVGIYNDFHAGRMKEAQEKQFRVNRFIRFYIDRYLGYYVGFVKHVMKYRGFEPGRARRPLLPITDEVERDIEATLKSIGFFHWPEIA